MKKIVQKTPVSQRRLKQKRMKKNIITITFAVLFFLEEFLNLIREDDILFEGISIGLGRANHTNHFCVALTGAGFQGCNNFFCHSSLSPILFDFFVNSHFL